MSILVTTSGSLDLFSRKINVEEFERRLKEAYLCGYYDRIVTEKVIKDNPVVHIGGANWYKFNYGATKQEDRELGAHASGISLSWYEASMIPYCKLPKRENLEMLLECTSTDVRYNIGLDHKPWNPRVALLDGDDIISFYEWGCYPRRDFVKGQHIVQCWLSDEIDEETALTMEFVIMCENQEKVGDYKGKLIKVDYVPVKKNEKLQAHFMHSTTIPPFENFVRHYLED